MSHSERLPTLWDLAHTRLKASSINHSSLSSRDRASSLCELATTGAAFATTLSSWARTPRMMAKWNAVERAQVPVLTPPRRQISWCILSCGPLASRRLDRLLAASWTSRSAASSALASTSRESLAINTTALSLLLDLLPSKPNSGLIWSTRMQTMKSRLQGSTQNSS